MLRPSEQEAREIAGRGEYRAIPISVEILSDITTPMEVLRALKAVSRHCFILESIEDRTKWGRYTFLGFNPRMEITCLGGETKITENGVVRTEKGNPRKFIEAALDDNKSPRLDYLPTFTGGLVGYFSYDYIKYSETSLDLSTRDDEGFNDVDLMLFDKVIAFDNFRQKIVLIVNIRADAEDFAAEYARGERELRELERLIKNGEKAEIPAPVLKSGWTPLFTKERFCEMVRKAKQFIIEGDIFQAVISNRFEAEFEGSLLDAYRVLRTTNPSPYMFYFGSDDLEIAGASPETLVKLQNGMLHTFPLAGTRPRGRTEEEDAAFERELLADAKELAEHNMLVDLGRNDLGRISKFGSVVVEKYLSVEKFSHVMHIGSTVGSEIRGDKKALDAMDAVLPAGTLSGAPKIRAMQIINELEENKRGIYGGAIGYLDFTGNMDTCIAIRIAYKKKGKVFVRSGAGIVADSVPETEYAECANKAKAVLAALGEAAGGLVP